MDESGGGQDCDPGQDFARRDGGEFTMGRKGWTTRGKNGGSVSYCLLFLFAFLLRFPFILTLVVNELTDSCSLFMQCNPAMRLADQSRGKPSVAIQRAAAAV